MPLFRTAGQPSWPVHATRGGRCRICAAPDRARFLTYRRDDHCGPRWLFQETDADNVTNGNIDKA